MKNLYEILGIDKGADSGTVKKAYRKKAQKLHPDKEEGDKEQFQELVAAYEVLIDDARRKKYDETGDIGSKVSDDSEALRSLVAVIFGLIDKVDDVRYVNLIEEAKGLVQEGLRVQAERIVELEESIKVREEVNRRLKKKEGHNVLADALQSDMEKRKQGVVAMRDNLDTGKALVAMLDEYEYQADVDVRPTRVRMGADFPTGFFKYNGR